MLHSESRFEDKAINILTEASPLFPIEFFFFVFSDLFYIYSIYYFF